jgi:hypothetical protein
LHVTTRRKHEWVRHDDRSSLLHASREALRDCRLGDLHVCGLYDCALANPRFYAVHDFVQQSVGFGAAAAMIDEENRAH